MKVEEIEKWYKENPDRFWGDVHIGILLSRIRILEEGVRETQQIISNCISIINKLQKLLGEENI